MLQVVTLLFIFEAEFNLLEVAEWTWFEITALFVQVITIQFIQVQTAVILPRTIALVL
jgi:hypothetical protein